MPVENPALTESFVGGLDGADSAAASVSCDTTSLSGAAAVGVVSLEGVDHVCVVVVYPVDDVAALNVSSLGSAVRNAALSVS